MRKIIPVLLLTLLNCSISKYYVEVTCVENCQPNKDVKISKRVVLLIKCKDNCLGVEYKWKVFDTTTQKEVFFNQGEVQGEDSMEFVINPDVLLPKKRYEVVCEARKKTKSRAHFIMLHMENCSEKHPCNDTTTSDPAQLETPEQTLGRIDSEVDELNTLDKKSEQFQTKQKELLENLLEVPLVNPKHIKQSRKALIKILLAGNLKLDPAMAKTTLQIIRKIVDAKLKQILNSKNPTSLKAEAEELFKTTTTTLTYTINENKTELMSHRKEKEDVNVTDQFLFTENYPLYDDFDVDFIQKKQNWQFASESSLQTLKKVTGALALTLSLGKQIEQFVNDDVCVIFVIDSPGNFKNRSFETCGVTLNVSNSLADELQARMNSMLLSFSVLKSNPFWWTDKNISSNLINVEIRQSARSDLVENLRNTFTFNTAFKDYELETVAGVVKFSNETGTGFADETISVHQLFVTKYLRTLMIRFPELKDNDGLQVVVFKDHRPLVEDFDGDSVRIMTSTGNTIIESIGVPSGSFCYVGVLPTLETIQKSGKSPSYNYKVQFSKISCESWDEVLLEWSDVYCEVDPQTTPKNLVCNCKHASTYGGFITNIESKTDEISYINFVLERQYNWIVLIVVICTCLLYIFALVYAIRKSRRKPKPKTILFLADNNLGFEYEYLVTVYTGLDKNAGTTANVGFTLEGSEAKSDYHCFRGHLEPVLQNGGADCFLLLTPKPLGNILQVTLWTDCYGVRSSWLCRKVVVTDLQNNKQWFFNINKWFSVLNNNVHSTINVSTREVFIPITRWDYVIFALKHKHLLVSLYQKAIVKQISFKEKLHLLLYIVTGNQLLLLLMYGPLTSELYGQLGAGHYDFGIVDFGLAFASALVVFIFSYILIYLFILSNHWETVAWIFLILIILISILISLLFGLYTNFITSQIWLTALLVSLLIWFLFETARVIIEALLKKEKPMLQPDKELDMSNIAEQKKQLWNKFGEKSMRPLFQKLYQPLSDLEIQIKREEELQRIELRAMVVDIIMFFIYLIVLLCVILANKDSMSHFSSRNIEKMFVTDEYCREMPIYEINSPKSLMIYLRETFVPALYATSWYANWTTNEPGLTIDFNTKMLGIPRIRQIRIQNDSCRVPQALKFLSNNCSPEYNSWIQTKSNYGLMWKKQEIFSHQENSDLIWLYQDGWTSQSTFVIGDLAIYPAGGYVVNLGRTKENTEIILDYLEKTKWFDEMTRAIFVEVYFYNANQNLFNVLKLIIEKSATEKYISSFSIHTSKLLFLYDELAISTFITLILFIVMVLIFSWKKIQQLKQTYISVFFSDTWNIVDLFIIFFAFGFILVNFIRSKAVGVLLEQLEKANHNDFVSFTTALYWDDFTTIVATVLVAISTIRIWKLLRFLRMFRVFELTLSLASATLMAMFILGTIVLFAYSASGHVMFGNQSEDFRTVGTSFLSLLLLSFGFHKNFDFEVLETSYAAIGLFYYIGFMIILIIIINLFITIIVIAYETAKDYFDENDKEKLVSYNMYNFLKDEFRFYTSKNKGREDWMRLKGGVDLLEEERNIEVKLKPDAPRKTLRLIQNRIHSMLNISEKATEVLLKQKSKSEYLSTPENLNFIAEITETLLPQAESPDDEQPDSEIYTVVPVEDTYQFCSNKRQNEMLLIVNYLLSNYINKKDKIDSDATLPQSAADKHTAMIISMNHTLNSIIEDLEATTSEMFSDKSTMVTFQDLNLEEIFNDSDDEEVENV